MIPKTFEVHIKEARHLIPFISEHRGPLAKDRSSALKEISILARLSLYVLSAMISEHPG